MDINIKLERKEWRQTESWMEEMEKTSAYGAEIAVIVLVSNN
jgi:hypothetical protein